MTFSDKITKELQAPLHPSKVKTREQSGRTLSYIEGWHAIDEANRIFGFDAWSRETVDIRMVSEGPRTLKSGKPAFGVSYVAKVRVIVEGVIREGVGAGHGIDADLGLAHESAIKEAETDAMKRALMTFGNPFGLALYDKTQANVGVDMSEHDETRARLLDAITRCASLEALADLWKSADTQSEMRGLPETHKLTVERAKDRRKRELTMGEAA